MGIGWQWHLGPRKTDRAARVNADEEVALLVALAGRISSSIFGRALCQADPNHSKNLPRQGEKMTTVRTSCVLCSGGQRGSDESKMGSRCIERRAHWSSTDSHIDHLIKMKSAFPRGRAPMSGCVRGNSRPSSSCCSIARHRSGFRLDDPRRLQEREPRRHRRCLGGRSNLHSRPTAAAGRRRDGRIGTPTRDEHVPRTSVQSGWAEPGVCIAADRQNSTKAFMAAEMWRWRG